MRSLDPHTNGLDIGIDIGLGPGVALFEELDQFMLLTVQQPRQMRPVHLQAQFHDLEVGRREGRDDWDEGLVLSESEIDQLAIGPYDPIVGQGEAIQREHARTSQGQVQAQIFGREPASHTASVERAARTPLADLVHELVRKLPWEIHRFLEASVQQQVTHVGANGCPPLSSAAANISASATLPQSAMFVSARPRLTGVEMSAWPCRGCPAG